MDSETFDGLKKIEDEMAFNTELLRQMYIDKMKSAPYDPKALFIVMRDDCLFSCDHCFFYSSPNSHKVLSDDAIEKSINFASKSNIEGVVLTGGEPMIDSPKVFRAIKNIKDNSLGAFLQSAYLGGTKHEIEKNAKIIGDLGVERFLTSLSMYHQATKPKTMKDNYLDNLLMILDAVTRNGIPVDIKNTWDVNIGTDSLDQTNEFNQKLLRLGASFLGEPYESREFVYIMNDKEIMLRDPSIISVGKARSKGLVSQKLYLWEENLYKCPIFYEIHHDGGMLTIYPDGNVARCCASEKNTDFGFGNILIDSFEDIIDNIRNSNYVHPDNSYILIEGHKMLKEEYPHLLPKGGASQPCEICSPIISHEKTKKRLSERLGDPELFMPYNHRNKY